MNDFSCILEEDININDIDFIKKELNKYNENFTEPDNHKILNVIIKDNNNNILGGLLGGTYWGWLYIDRLWIDEKYRKNGLGTKILEIAEKEAKKRGCKFAHLDTHDFQAVDFYIKKGYEIISRLNDLPKGYNKYLMKKIL